MKMTAEQWKEVETQLSWTGGVARLRIDGYDLQFEVRPTKPLRWVIVPFVNGYSRGAWLSRNDAGEWCEEARRFLPLKTRCLFTATELARAGKKLAKELRQKKFEYRSYCWTSFAAMKRHLIANNESIELVEEKPV
jgi:hypothetical protein